MTVVLNKETSLELAEGERGTVVGTEWQIWNWKEVSDEGPEKYEFYR